MGYSEIMSKARIFIQSKVHSKQSKGLKGPSNSERVGYFNAEHSPVIISKF